MGGNDSFLDKKLQFPKQETPVSHAGNDSFPCGERQFPIGGTPVSRLGNASSEARNDRKHLAFYLNGYQLLSSLKIFTGLYFNASLLESCFAHATRPEVSAPSPVLPNSA